MKKIELRKIKGRTTKCFRRALKLINKGENVIYASPHSIGYVHNLFLGFKKIIENRKIDYACFPLKETIEFPNKECHIRFVMWDYLMEHFSEIVEECYNKDGWKLIIEDADVILKHPDTISVTKWSKTR